MTEREKNYDSDKNIIRRSFFACKNDGVLFLDNKYLFLGIPEQYSAREKAFIRVTYPLTFFYTTICRDHKKGTFRKVNIPY